MNNTDPDMAAQQRRASRWLGLLLLGMAAIALWLAGDDLWALFAGSARGAQQVTVSLGAATALAAGFSVLILATMLVVSPSPTVQKKLFRTALASLSFALIFPLLLSFWAEEALPRRGYESCPNAVPGMRFPVYVWVYRDRRLCPVAR